jgi:chromosome segregation ATPase
MSKDKAELRKQLIEKARFVALHCNNSRGRTEPSASELERLSLENKTLQRHIRELEDVRLGLEKRAIALQEVALALRGEARAAERKLDDSKVQLHRRENDLEARIEREQYQNESLRGEVNRLTEQLRIGKEQTASALASSRMSALEAVQKVEEVNRNLSNEIKGLEDEHAKLRQLNKQFEASSLKYREKYSELKLKNEKLRHAVQQRIPYLAQVKLEIFRVLLLAI